MSFSPNCTSSNNLKDQEKNEEIIECVISLVTYTVFLNSDKFLDLENFYALYPYIFIVFS